MEENPAIRVTWLTPDYFWDVDAYIVPHLRMKYQINWILINSVKTNRTGPGIAFDGKPPCEFNLKYRHRDPRIILQYISLLRKIKKSDTDLLYLTFEGAPYFFFLLFLFINPLKVIFGMHNVSVPKGAANEYITKLYYKYGFKRLKYIHIFSKYQMEKVRAKFPGRKYYYSPLSLKDFGPSSILASKNKIRFLFFGYIRNYKRLDLLIDSFQSLYKSGFDNIELFIAGACENWIQYERKIFLPHAIKTRIEMIPNKDIPDLASSCHYFVLPYQDGTQSGVIPVAYQYNKPVIVSDIEAFQQFVKEGVTGYFFKNGSREDLFNVLKTAVINHEFQYQNLVDNVSRFSKMELSLDEILNRYHQMLQDVLPG